MPETTQTRRLEEWLKQTDLLKHSQRCIDNFVRSCKEIDNQDMRNFLCRDLIGYSMPVQIKLIQGFLYIYFGIKPAVYLPENIPERSKVYLN